MSDWQLIETAPRDGTPVLLGWDQGFHAMDGHCKGGVWGDLTSDFDFEPFQIQPSHWMPMPTPPARR